MLIWIKELSSQIIPRQDENGYPYTNWFSKFSLIKIRQKNFKKYALNHKYINEHKKKYNKISQTLLICN